MSELLFLQAAPEAVISLCNEMSNDMVKTQKDSCAPTFCQCQDPLASSEQEQCRACWEQSQLNVEH